MPFLIGSGGGSSASALAVKNTHIFANTTARNTYFTSNPSELVEDIYISVSGVLQKRVSGTWVDTSAVVKGADGADAQTPIVSYSVDGLSGWTSALNPAIHKYWRWSTNNGVIWTPAVKFVADDSVGTGVPAPYEYAINGSNQLELLKGGTPIMRVDEFDLWTRQGVSTGDGDLNLGEMHYIASAGDMVTIKNQSANMFMFPSYGAISPDGNTIIDPAARIHTAGVQIALPAGAAGSNSVDYNSSFIPVSNSVFISLNVTPKETFIGKLILTVKNLTSNREVSELTFDANITSDVPFLVSFKNPLWLRAGQNYSTTITKVNGDYLIVRSNSAGDQPYREASYLTFADYPLFHAGNPTAVATSLNTLLGANRISFSAVRDVPLMSGTVAGVAKLGSTMSINGNGELNTSISPTGIKIVADQAARLAIPQTGGAILAIQQDDGKTYGIEAGQDTSVLLNWKQIGTVATNVVSFNGRNGAVVPTVDDYNMEQIGLTDRINAKKYVFRVDNGVPYLEEIA